MDQLQFYRLNSEKNSKSIDSKFHYWYKEVLSRSEFTMHNKESKWRKPSQEISEKILKYNHVLCLVNQCKRNRTAIT
jgi:hypothetical protein